MFSVVTRKLENLEDKYSTVETILSYSFDYNQYWGSHEGVARGLPTKIFEKDVSVPAEIYWALKHTERKSENKAHAVRGQVTFECREFKWAGSKFK